MEFHVVYISDDNFASKLGTSLLSMFEHNLDLQIVVHILIWELMHSTKTVTTIVRQLFSKMHLV